MTSYLIIKTTETFSPSTLKNICRNIHPGTIHNFKIFKISETRQLGTSSPFIPFVSSGLILYIFVSITRPFCIQYPTSHIPAVVELRPFFGPDRDLPRRIKKKWICSDNILLRLHKKRVCFYIK
ncbi:hypothetical protein BDC45DRAFT_552393 [Circinella umbellata]|nr:hypothetical protein BDC45DRAFT_552393 [Circinella umbellata]